MLQYWVWYALLPELSNNRKRHMLEVFSDPETIYKMKDYREYPLLTEEEIAALNQKDLQPAREIMGKCEEKDIKILHFMDTAYPERLRNISQLPIILYYKGTVPDLAKRPAVGIVGTRKATPYGKETAKTIGQQIAACGGVVVSGGAVGIDSCALEGAIQAGGQVVTVLGCGVDISYPAINRKLFEVIAENGCLISEYPPGTKPQRWHFPERNRIISGISNGILVVEAPERSGALITAREALEQGREVFVTPGNIDNPTSVGSNSLLKDGAEAVLSGWDLLERYAVDYPDTVMVKEPVLRQDLPVVLTVEKTKKPESAMKKNLVSPKKDIDIRENRPYSVLDDAEISLNDEERAVIAFLSQTPILEDQLVEKMDCSADQTMRIVTKLALMGVVKTYPGGLVSLS